MTGIELLIQQGSLPHPGLPYEQNEILSLIPWLIRVVRRVGQIQIALMMIQVQFIQFIQ